jgi:hypothetical protein
MQAHGRQSTQNKRLLYSNSKIAVQPTELVHVDRTHGIHPKPCYSIPLVITLPPTRESHKEGKKRKENTCAIKENSSQTNVNACKFSLPHQASREEKMTQGWVVYYDGIRHAEPQREMFSRSYKQAKVQETRNGNPDTQPEFSAITGRTIKRF